MTKFDPRRLQRRYGCLEFRSRIAWLPVWEWGFKTDDGTIWVRLNRYWLTRVVERREPSGRWFVFQEDQQELMP